MTSTRPTRVLMLLGALAISRVAFAGDVEAGGTIPVTHHEVVAGDAVATGHESSPAAVTQEEAKALLRQPPPDAVVVMVRPEPPRFCPSGFTEPGDC
jgi:hypothetical protein